MIQAVSSINATPIRKHSPNFGDKAPATQADYRSAEVIAKQEKKAMKKAKAKFIGSQFLSGVVVSTVFDSVINLFNLARKKHEFVRSLPAMGINAVITGAAFVAMAYAFMGIDKIMRRNQH